MLKSQIILRYFFYIVLVEILVIFFSACSSNKTNYAKNKNSYLNLVNVNDICLLQSYQKDFEKLMFNLKIKSKIMDQYYNWKGVRYLLGGNSKHGIDCSAFVQRTFLDQFGLWLPRSTSKQKKIGKFISRANLQTGDLVLFKSGSTGHHVGIYIDNNQFIHASASNGVIISNLNKPYWKKHYNEARRILIQY